VCFKFISILSQFLIPAISGQPPKQSSVERFLSGTERVLENFEEHWLKDNKFIGGDKISIADIFAVCEIYQLGELFIMMTI